MKPSRADIIFHALGILIVSTPLLLVGNYLMAYPIWQQYQTRLFSKTSALAIRAVVVTDSEHPKLKVRYRYQVDGRVYEGTRYYVEGILTDKSRRKLAAKLNRAEVVPVYYDPEDASIAVLNNQLQYTMVFFLGFIILAINMFTLAAWSAWFNKLRLCLAKEVVDGGVVKRIKEPRENRIILRTIVEPASYVMGLGGGCLSLVGVFVLGLALAILGKTIALGIGTLWMVMVVVIVVHRTLQLYYYDFQGKNDLIIDARERILTLPSGESKSPNVMVPFDQLSITANRKQGNARLHYHTEASPTVSKHAVFGRATMDWLRTELLNLGVELEVEEDEDDYPVEDLVIVRAEQSNGSLHIAYIGSGEGVPMAHEVETLKDRLIVSWTKSRRLAATPDKEIVIENPTELPVYISDGTVTKQVYPVNELAAETPPQ